MKLKVADTPRLYTIDLQTRMPFRYGIATLTALPHLFLELQLDIDGEVHRGIAAENLAPKWFTKNPHTTPQQDIDELLMVIRAACRFRFPTAGRSVAEAFMLMHILERAAQAQLRAMAATSGSVLIGYSAK